MFCEHCHHHNLPQNLVCEKCQEKLYRAKLRVTFTSGQDQTHYLFPKKYRIGRDADNDIVIMDSSVSRLHAEIDFQDGSFIISDKDSKNGSLLNNDHFHHRRLYDLDCIQLGNVVLHFYDEKNKALLAPQGEDTAEWVLKEFFKFSASRRTKITTNDVLLTMLDLAVSLVHADQALILQFNPDNHMRFKLGKKQGGQSLFENHLSEFDWTIINESIRNKTAKIVARNVSARRRIDSAAEELAWSKMAIPLISIKGEPDKKHVLGMDGVLGVFYFTQNKKRNMLTPRKRELLSTIVQQVAFAVENEMLYDQTLVKRKIEQELSLAREIQQRMLPVPNPSISKLDIASYVNPCEAVSGDYFDLIPISARNIGIAIGDICGKGVPAALLSAAVQAAIHCQLEYTSSPEQIVGNLNRLLIRSTAESIFLTLFFGILDLDTGELKYINAGHPPPIFIKRDRSIKELSGTTPALGILEGKFEHEKGVNFEAGDILLLYTDGIIESQNPDKKIYGRKRLLKLIHSLFANGKSTRFKLDTMINRIKNDVVQFIEGAKQTDDLTILAIKRH